jgi:large subunit ribosomal protein L4
MIQQAYRCALSDRARSGALRLIDRWTMEVPRTKDALAALRALECEGRVLVVVGRGDEVVERSFRNVPEIVTLPGDQVTAYDLLAADVVVYTDDSLPGEVSAAPATASAPAKAGPVKPAARKAVAKPAAAAPVTDERGEK